jgi:hypothetical protein
MLGVVLLTFFPDAIVVCPDDVWIVVCAVVVCDDEVVVLPVVEAVVLCFVVVCVDEVGAMDSPSPEAQMQ